MPPKIQDTQRAELIQKALDEGFDYQSGLFREFQRKHAHNEEYKLLSKQQKQQVKKAWLSQMLSKTQQRLEEEEKQTVGERKCYAGKWLSEELLVKEITREGFCNALPHLQQRLHPLSKMVEYFWTSEEVQKYSTMELQTSNKKEIDLHSSGKGSPKGKTKGNNNHNKRNHNNNNNNNKSKAARSAPAEKEHAKTRSAATMPAKASKLQRLQSGEVEQNLPEKALQELLALYAKTITCANALEGLMKGQEYARAHAMFGEEFTLLQQQLQGLVQSDARLSKMVFMGKVAFETEGEFCETLKLHGAALEIKCIQLQAMVTQILRVQAALAGEP